MWLAVGIANSLLLIANQVEECFDDAGSFFCSPSQSDSDGSCWCELAKGDSAESKPLDTCCDEADAFTCFDQSEDCRPSGGSIRDMRGKAGAGAESDDGIE